MSLFLHSIVIEWSFYLHYMNCCWGGGDKRTHCERLGISDRASSKHAQAWFGLKSFPWDLPTQKSMFILGHFASGTSCLCCCFLFMVTAFLHTNGFVLLSQLFMGLHWISCLFGNLAWKNFRSTVWLDSVFLHIHSWILETQILV